MLAKIGTQVPDGPPVDIAPIEPNYRCWACRDSGVVVYREANKDGMTYTYAAPCSCGPGQAILGQTWHEKHILPASQLFDLDLLGKAYYAGRIKSLAPTIQEINAACVDELRDEPVPEEWQREGETT